MIKDLSLKKLLQITILQTHLLCIAIFLGGCSYMSMVMQKQQIQIKLNSNNSPTLNRKLNPERCYTVYGIAHSRLKTERPTAVIALSYQDGKPEVVDSYFLKNGGYFSLFLPEGRYTLLAFADVNNDRKIDNNELVGGYKEELTLFDTLSKSSKIMGDIDIFISMRSSEMPDLSFSLDLPQNYSTYESAPYPPGTLRSLADPIFSAEVSQRGVYEPSEFIKISPIYFYALNQFQPQKTPVIFVHGYGGRPSEFKFLVDNLDTALFQPWFFYYPSGQSLTKTGDIFYEIFLSDKIIKMKQRRIVIFAHSMGGLVVKHALNRYSQDGGGRGTIDFVSACTPYGGNPGAAKAIKSAPVVVPSWIDIAAESEVLQNLYTQKFADNITFNLLFAFKSASVLKFGENSDGTITLNSQLSPEIQNLAVKMFGFDETHESILVSKPVAAYFNNLLKKPTDTK
jgi:pimeloyl-ACP methyl ester carboxylesterase